MRARVEAARQRWNAGDLPGYLSLYDDAIKLHGYTPEPMTKQAVTGFYQMIWATMAAEGKPNPTLTFHEVLTDGDLYSCRFTMAGVHQGPFMGVPATGASPMCFPASPSCGLAAARSWSAGRAPTCSACWCRSAPCRRRPQDSYST